MNEMKETPQKLTASKLSKLEKEEINKYLEKSGASESEKQKVQQLMEIYDTLSVQERAFVRAPLAHYESFVV